MENTTDIKLIESEIKKGVDEANKEIKKDGAWVGYPIDLEVINDE